MPKNTYWLTDGYGAKAFIEGADQRDRWTPLGWSETTDPDGDDRVWLRHIEHGGRALFAAGAVELWREKGWEPSDPPAPVDPFSAVAPADASPAETPVNPATAGKADPIKEK